MVYNRLTWRDLPSETTPISAERLSHMETQYSEAVAYTDSALASGLGVKPVQEEARKGGWSYLYDPTVPSSRQVNGMGAVTQLQDTLGNYPNLVLGSPASVETGSFGSFDGLRSRSSMTHSTGSPTSFHVFALAEYRKTAESQTIISFGSGVADSGLELRVLANGELHIGRPTFQWRVKIPEGVLLFEVEGTPDYLRVRVNGHWAFETTSGTLSFNMSTLVFGADQEGARQWSGPLGLIAFSDHALSDVDVNRFRDTILSRCSPRKHGPLGIDPRVRVLVQDSDGTTVAVQNDPYFVPSHSMASVTKSINALTARKYLTTSSSLSQDVTVLEEDIFSGASNLDKLQAGDIFTIRELLTLSLGPSNDTAPRVIARVVGNLIPGSLPPRAKFVRAMQDFVDQELSDRGGIVQNVRASSMLSAKHGAELAKRLSEDPELTFCASRPAGYTVQSRGVNPRAVNGQSGVHTYGMWFPEHICSKGGSVGSTWSHLVVAFQVRGVKYSGAIFSVHESYWESDSARRRTAIMASVDAVRTGTIIDAPDLRSVMGSEVFMTGPRDITDAFVGCSRNSGFAGSGVYIERVDKQVHLSMIDMTVPADYTRVGAIPAAFTPGFRIRGNFRLAADNSSVGVLVLDTGQIYLTPSSSGRVSGSMSWPIIWVGLYPADIPGIPPNYYNGSDT